ncbi:MAG: hypothetical protein WCL07_03200 [bacterium]
MSNINYDTAPEIFVTTKPKSKLRFNFSLRSIGSNLLALLKLVVAVALTGFAAILSVGVFSALSSNITFTGVEVQFDPMITIAYLGLAYFLSNHYQLDRSQGFRYFILALILSYTTPFLQGSFFLLLIIPTLQLFRLINSPKSQ